MASWVCKLLSTTEPLPVITAQVLFDRNYEDAYTDPGSPAKRRTPQGTYVLAQLADDDGARRRRLLMQARRWSAMHCRHDDGGARQRKTMCTSVCRAVADGPSMASLLGLRCHVQGSGASPEGNKPFVDILDVESGESQRIWQSKPPFYESTGAHDLNSITTAALS